VTQRGILKFILWKAITAMLRIFLFEEPYSVKLRLEGKLIAPTAPLLTQRWAELRTRLKGRKLVLDLGDVVEIDEAGRQLLKWLAESGASLDHPRPDVVHMLKDLICSDQRKISRFGSRVRKTLCWLGCGEALQTPPSRLCRALCILLPSSLRPCACRVT
jgi:hypothetical protein